MKKLVFLALTVVLLLASTSAFASEAPVISDVTSDDWAYEEISSMAELGYAVPDENGNLNPSEALKVSHLSVLPDEIKARAFSAIEKVSNGTNISLEKELTRAEFISAVVKAINASSEYKGSSFADVTDDMWYAPDVECAKTIGLINGYEDGTFRGESKVSKREALVIGYRLKAFLDVLAQ